MKVALFSIAFLLNLCCETLQLNELFHKVNLCIWYFISSRLVVIRLRLPFWGVFLVFEGTTSGGLVKVNLLKPVMMLLLLMVSEKIKSAICL